MFVTLKNILRKRCPVSQVETAGLFFRFYSTKEMKILNVAEKNDAAKNIAALLSGGSAHKRTGLSPYNKIFEFECEIFNRNNKMIMTSVSGHLLNMDFVGHYRGWHSVHPISLFEAPVTKSCRKSDEHVMKNIQEEVKNCNTLIIWTDCDREGENIGFQIIDICKKIKPNIRVYRAKFSEITEASVKRAIEHLEEPNPHISDAVNVRMELDLRIGAAFTRFQCLHLWQAFPNALKGNIISYGSCQFPTLGFVVERFKAISEFVSEAFWKVSVDHAIENVKVTFQWKRNHLFDKLACEVLYEKCMECKTAKVISVQSKPKIKWKPKPLDTVEMEKIISRKLKINAKETLKIAEKLYCQGLISYPRTETNIFPKELDLIPLVVMQTQNSNWGAFAQRVLTDGPSPSYGSKSDQAHPPIHPIKYTDSLSGNEKRVYEYIVRHFLACLSKNAQGLETIVDIDIADEKFTAKGLMVTARNYLDVYTYDTWSDKEMHIYHVGDTFTPEISMTEGATSPPEFLTEADLISLMEKHGIGTDATHAEHIETIKSRLYVGLQNEKYFVPRTLGMGLVEGYISMGYEMSKPKLRADLEADLKSICQKKASPEEVLKRHINNYKNVFEGIQRQASCLSETVQSYIQVEALPVNITLASEPIVRNCGSCGSPMLLKQGKNKRCFYIGCSAFPECRVAQWLPSRVTNVQVLDDTCSKCGPAFHLLKLNFERGSTYLPDDYVCCLGGCDENILEVLNCGSHQGLKVKNNSNIPPLREINSRSRSSATNLHQKSHFSTSFSGPSCHCNVNAMELTVKKEGPNYGRVFYKCSAKNNQCNFFEWKDAPTSGNRNKQNNPNGKTRARVDADSESEIRCFCAIHSKRLIVTKEGPNKGREFFSCGKSITDKDKCNFFKWAT